MRSWLTGSFIRLWVMILLVLIAVVVLLPVVSHAQIFCANVREIMSGLERKYGEEIVATGTVKQGTESMLLLGGTTGSYSILVVKGDGLACLIISGEDLEIIKYVKGKKS